MVMRSNAGNREALELFLSTNFQELGAMKISSRNIYAKVQRVGVMFDVFGKQREEGQLRRQNSSPSFLSRCYSFFTVHFCGPIFSPNRFVTSRVTPCTR